MNINKKILVLIMAVFGATDAYSAENFTGFSASLNLDLNGTTAYTTNSSSHIRFGDNDSKISIQGSYGFKVNEISIFSIGASFSPTEINSGDFGNSSESSSFKVKNSWTMYVAPGVALDNSLIYTKFGITGMTGEVATSSRTQTKGWNGVVYGLGLRTFLKENIYIQLEANKFDWGSESKNGTTIDVKNTQASIGLGMKF